ncbi:MAG: GntR family transcriptional regulator [Thermodesulfobacteriota bacterium]
MERLVMLPPPSAMKLTSLQAHVVREIVAYVRRENLKAGERLTESYLAEQIGTSRSPINMALRHLAGLGIVTHDLNRGFFLNKDSHTLADIAQQFASQPDDPLYLRIAEDRLTHRLPDMVNEVDMMRLYRTSRSSLRKVLSRIQQEGWVRKSIGYGWRFQAMIDSPEAYEESYVFRAAIEPTGLLSSGFKADSTELESLRLQQQFITDGGFETMTAIELFVANCQFHETLAKWSHNRFVLQSVRRINQLRRLIEYRQALKRPPRRVHSQEHLAIIDAIAHTDLPLAANLMRTHLEKALRNKIFGNNVFVNSKPYDVSKRTRKSKRRS